MDVSGKRLEIARWKAREAGLRVDYVRSSVLFLPLRGGAFDVVYTSGGVLGWLPDLKRWAREAARVLRKGGRMVILEFHPFLHMLKWKRGRPQLAFDYFDKGPLLYRNRAPVGTQVEHVWKVSDIVTALMDAGLDLKRMEELPAMGRRKFVFPHRILLVFAKS